MPLARGIIPSKLYLWRKRDEVGGLLAGNAIAIPWLSLPHDQQGHRPPTTKQKGNLHWYLRS